MSAMRIISLEAHILRSKMLCRSQNYTHGGDY
jgi:hypothetical protein